MGINLFFKFFTAEAETDIVNDKSMKTEIKMEKTDNAGKIMALLLFCK